MVHCKNSYRMTGQSLSAKALMPDFLVEVTNFVVEVATGIYVLEGDVNTHKHDVTTRGV